MRDRQDELILRVEKLERRLRELEDKLRNDTTKSRVAELERKIESIINQKTK
jgi:DNA-binding transcriptional regulator WhiA